MGKPIADYKKHIKANICINAETQCWEWQRALTTRGYGKIFYNRKVEAVHRLSYKLFKGDIPIHASYHGMCVLHKCDNRKCCNPEHLFLGTNHDNNRDMMNKNRNGQPKGEDNGRNILSEQQVHDIKHKYIPYKYGCPKLADEFNVSKSCIALIINGKNWKHLQENTK